MSSATAFPTVAPRGRVFAVSRLSHVADRNVRVELVGTWRDRDSAEQAFGAIDWRLVPTIDLARAE